MIYLDHHATTPVDPRVLDGDAAVLHREVRQRVQPHASGPAGTRNDAVERARKQVAALIGADAREIVFTSGATEANNLAIMAREWPPPADRRSCGDGCHRAQGRARPVRALEHEGWQVTVLPVRRDGRGGSGRRRDGGHAAHGAGQRDAGATTRSACCSRLPAIARLAHERGALCTPTPCRRWASCRLMSMRSTWTSPRSAPTSSTGRRASAPCIVKRGIDKRLRAPVTRRRPGARASRRHPERAGHRRVRGGLRSGGARAAR